MRDSSCARQRTRSADLLSFSRFTTKRLIEAQTLCSIARSEPYRMNDCCCAVSAHTPQFSLSPSPYFLSDLMGNAVFGAVAAVPEFGHQRRGNSSIQWSSSQGSRLPASKSVFHYTDDQDELCFQLTFPMRLTRLLIFHLKSFLFHLLVVLFQCKDYYQP